MPGPERLFGRGLGPNRKPPHIFPQDAIQGAHHDEEFTIPHALSTFWIERVDRGRNLRESMGNSLEGLSNSDSKRNHAIEGVFFLGKLDLADRYANTKFIALTRDNRDPNQWSNFGVFTEEAYNHPLYKDHGFEHQGRRVERYIEKLVLELSPLRHQQSSVARWLRPLFTSAREHDWDQVISLHRNTVEGRTKTGVGNKRELDVKAGHAEGSAVMTMATAHRVLPHTTLYEQDVDIDRRVGAYFEFDHDVPEALGDILAAQEKPWTVRDGKQERLYGPELLEKHKQHSLDGMYISPSQIVDITFQKKVKAGGFVTLEGLMPLDSIIEQLRNGDLPVPAETAAVQVRMIRSIVRRHFRVEHIGRIELTNYAKADPRKLMELIHDLKDAHLDPRIEEMIDWDKVSVLGFHPQFEQEYFDQLYDLAKDERSLLGDMQETSRASLRLAKEAFVRADYIEMVAPYWPALFRKFMTKWSIGREFFPSQQTLDSLKLWYNDYLVNEKHQPPTEAEGAALLVEVSRNAPGNLPKDLNIDSDVRRQLQECFHIDEIGEEIIQVAERGDTRVFSDISKSELIYEMNRDNSIMSLLALRYMGERLLQGDLSFINMHYDKRINDISKKALNEAGYHGFQVVWHEAECRRKGLDFSAFTREKIAKYDEGNLLERYDRNVQVLRNEARNMHYFLCKQEPPENGDVGELPTPRIAPMEELEMFHATCDIAIREVCDRYHIDQRELKKYTKRMLEGKFPSSTPFKGYDSLAAKESMRHWKEMPPPPQGAKPVFYDR